MKTMTWFILFVATACGGGAKAPLDSASGNHGGRREMTRDEAVFSQYRTPIEGFGVQSRGGRGGAIIEVTNLDDSGPGSLRACVEAEGPRNCVFRVGGTIELERQLNIGNPYLTIAGQTAPGGGITLKSDYPVVLGTGLEIGEAGRPDVHDVILQHLRFRRSTRPGVAPIDDNRDALTVLGGSHDIVIDHCSFSWGTDETLSVVDRSYNVTVQWCIVAESFFKGSLVSSGARNVTIHHTLYAHNPERNPKLKGRPEYLEGQDAIFDFVNNVVYDWRGYATAVAGSGMANVVANYYKLGPGTPAGADWPGEEYGEVDEGETPETPVVRGWPKPREIVRMQDLPIDGVSVRRVFAQGNVGPTCPQGCADEWDGGMVSDIEGRLGDISRADTPLAVPPVTTTSAGQAFEEVLERAGASFGLDNRGHPFYRRDAVDGRIAADVRGGTGAVIDRRVPIPPGAWPAFEAGTAYVDEDGDGMADGWERDHGLDADDADDHAADADGDGVTNVEEFFNLTDPTRGN